MCVLLILDINLTHPAQSISSSAPMARASGVPDVQTCSAVVCLCCLREGPWRAGEVRYELLNPGHCGLFSPLPSSAFCSTSHSFKVRDCETRHTGSSTHCSPTDVSNTGGGQTRYCQRDTARTGSSCCQSVTARTGSSCCHASFPFGHRGHARHS